MAKFDSPIYVTRPDFPPLEDFNEYLKKIWENKILTNNGPFHQELEHALTEYLGVKYISLFSNGTLALITALQTLRITGEVITTPFSFVATSHSLWWNGIKPVFVDIENDSFNLDPQRIEAAITPKTTAIMPVHVYGNPCNLDAIRKISETYGLKVIYDAAHAFGVKKRDDSVLNMGDLSILSFHATKVFNTVEGGAIVCHDEKTKMQIDHLKNFGFTDELTVVAPGINAKMNEIQSAYGLLLLKNIDSAIEKRSLVAQKYRGLLKDVKGIRCLYDIKGIRHNYSYFPILVDQNHYPMTRDDLYGLLKKNNIFGRRYFFPLISNFPTYNGLDSSRPENLPVATMVAKQVLCLPIYPALDLSDVEKICDIIIRQV
ncbi:MAG: DegT/DnrJ/EryC1/StrS family aminotransferase [Ignavibacteriaceae bacterium]|nr:DegT/DnrJ/EryC1/StrS family aminotransferase [Ignavibacteriaceae bacterium]